MSRKICTSAQDSGQFLTFEGKIRSHSRAFTKKQQGKTLGKPKGTLQKSKFDADLERIKDLLKLGLSVRKIATFLGYTNHLALNTYINKRKLREQGSEEIFSGQK